MPHAWGRQSRPLLHLFLFAGLLAAAGPAAAGDRYDLDAGREAALLGAGAAAGWTAWRWSAAQDGPTDADIAALDAAALPAIDRPAAGMWSDRAAAASDVLAYGLQAAPLLLLLETGDAMSAGDLGVMWLETALLQQATVGMLKARVGRVRPYVYNDDPRIADEYRRRPYASRSFPSGHTASAFAAAVFTGEVYARLNPDDASRHWVRGGTLAMAAATGWLRVRAGRHFPTDVLAGAAIGALAGWLVPLAHEADGGAAIDPAADPGRVAPPPPGVSFGIAI